MRLIKVELQYDEEEDFGYDDYEVIECVKVISKTEIIIFKGGCEVRAEVKKK